MAATFSLRAGSSWRVNVEYRNPPTPPSTDPRDGSLIDTSDLTARLQIRAASGNHRVLISAKEGSAPSALLRPDPEAETGGLWKVFLPASITRTLPPVSYLEVELVSNLNADDIITLFTGALHVSPEIVYN